MALIQINFYSKELEKIVPINCILPVDKRMREGKQDKPFQTLYLLHGLTGNYTDWVAGSNIQRWAEEADLAVVMPSGENSFYVDNPGVNKDYGEFIGKELVELTRKMFHLSHKRENTFIAGLSMGGYGAIRNGLKYHDTFGYIAGLSSALITDGIENRSYESPTFFEGRAFAEDCFGDLDLVATSDKNPKWLVKKLVEENVSLPKIYMACGEEDFLLNENRDFKNYLETIGVDVFYEEGPGGHDWDYWNTYIKKVLDWLPLEHSGEGGVPGSA